MTPSNGFHDFPAEPSPAPLGKDKVTQVVIKKSSPELRLGVRLAARKDGYKEGVEVINVHPKGPLAKVIQKGDIMLRSAWRARSELEEQRPAAEPSPQI